MIIWAIIISLVIIVVAGKILSPLLKPPKPEESNTIHLHPELRPRLIEVPPPQQGGTYLSRVAGRIAEEVKQRMTLPELSEPVSQEPEPILPRIQAPQIQEEEVLVQILNQTRSAINYKDLEEHNPRAFFINIKGALHSFIDYRGRISRSKMVPHVFAATEWKYLIGSSTGKEGEGLLRQLDIVADKADTTTTGSITFKVKQWDAIISIIYQWYLQKYPEHEAIIKEQRPAAYNGVKNRQGQLDQSTYAQVPNQSIKPGQASTDDEDEEDEDLEEDEEDIEE